MFKNTIATLGLSALLLGLGACATTHQGSEEVVLEETARVQLVGSLGDHLVIEGALLDHTKSPSVAQVHLRNKHNQSVPIRYRFTWLDDRGMQVGVTDGAFKDMTAQSFDHLYIREQAPFPVATDFRLLVRRR